MTLQDFLCVPGYYPIDEMCSEITFRFWDNLLVRWDGEGLEEREREAVREYNERWE